MSSGFVSGGTNEAPIERDAEWLAAQVELEAIRARKAAEARPTDGRSLFEVLEANKVAKQDAFEEANRLKNQFRSLDADEIDFLDSVLESTRAEEDRVKKETQEGLEKFRKGQDEVDKMVAGGGEAGEGGDWGFEGRKRKRKVGEKDRSVLKGVKIRRASSSEDAKTASPKAVPEKLEPAKGALETKAVGGEKKASPKTTPAVSPPPKTQPAATTRLGLVDYGSDSDDD